MVSHPVGVCSVRTCSITCTARPDATSENQFNRRGEPRIPWRQCGRATRRQMNTASYVPPQGCGQPAPADRAPGLLPEAGAVPVIIKMERRPSTKELLHILVRTACISCCAGCQSHDKGQEGFLLGAAACGSCSASALPGTARRPQDGVCKLALFGFSASTPAAGTSHSSLGCWQST